MKVTFTIRHTEMVTPPRCRKARPQGHESEVTANIREVSADRAPVAFVVREYDCEPRKVRHYNSKLWRQVQDRCENYTKRTKLSPLWVNRTAGKTAWGWLLKPNFGTFNTSGKYWDYGTLEANKSSIAKKAENYIIVDGEAYERTGEPYYYVTCFGLGNNHGSTGFFVGWADYRDRKAVWGWTAANKAKAINGAVEIALNRGDTESEDHIKNTPCDIHVLMPECIKRRYAKDF